MTRKVKYLKTSWYVLKSQDFEIYENQVNGIFKREAKLCSRNMFGFLISSWLIFSVFIRMSSTVSNIFFSELAEKQGGSLKCPHYAQDFQRQNCSNITKFSISFWEQERQKLPKNSSLNSPTQHIFVTDLLCTETWFSSKIKRLQNSPTLSNHLFTFCICEPII